MTKNTKFYKVSTVIDRKKQDIHYRDLTVTELNVVLNIGSQIVMHEMAASLSITNIDPKKIPFGTKMQIGEDIIYRSSRLTSEPSSLDVTISEFRKNIKEGDPVMSWISHITKYFPGTSVIDLLSLTLKDLVELVVMAEEMSGEKIFGSRKKGMSLVNPMDLPDGGKALRQQIKDLNKSIGAPR